MRNMSFALTTPQFLARTKTVTRRIGWSFLKPGDLICGVKKSMGLKKGEKIERLGVIRILSIKKARLLHITQSDVVKEGFPDWTPAQFIQMLVDHYNITGAKILNRIEFEYVEGK